MKLKIVILVFLLLQRSLSQDGGFLSQGNQYYRDGYFREAIEAYKKAIEGGENQALAWFNLGNAWYQNGDTEKAIACYELATLEAPDFARGWVNLGVLYHEMHDYGACIAALERALRITDNDPFIFSVLASAYKELRQYSSAVLYLEKALEADSTVSDAFLMLHEIARKLGDPKEALRWLRRYPRDGARLYEILLVKGTLLKETADTAGALSAFRRCTQVAPERMGGWVELVTHLGQMNTVYTALIEAQTALEKNESFVPLSLLAGRMAFEAGYYERAEQFFTRAYHAGHPEGVVGLSNLKTVYARFNDGGSISRIRKKMSDFKDGK